MREMTENELKELIQKFIERWDNTNSLKWKDLLPDGKRVYRGYTLKMSFGEGGRIQPPKCPWITFLKYGQTTSKGVYPIINYKCEDDSLATFLGVSFRYKPDIEQDVLDEIQSVKHTVSSNIDEIIKALNHNMEIFDEIMKKKEHAPQHVSKINKKTYLNQILYGPPGTGKTYNTVNKALEIIFSSKDMDKEKIYKYTENKIEKEISYKNAVETDNRMALQAIFNYFRKEKQIEFVTFHQSYGYEEFIEGIRAHIAEDNDDPIYRLEKGIFKKISKRAEENYKKVQNKRPNNESEDIEYDFSQIIDDYFSYVSTSLKESKPVKLKRDVLIEDVNKGSRLAK